MIRHSRTCTVTCPYRYAYSVSSFIWVMTTKALVCLIRGHHRRRNE